MKKQLYVGNLPTELTEEGLRDLFARGGREVASVKIRTNARTGRSRGFGFVEMASEAEAEAARAELHGLELEGRALKVSEALHDGAERPVPAGMEYDEQPRAPRRRR